MHTQRPSTGELARLRSQCWRIGRNLFEHVEEAEAEIDAIVAEAAETFGAGGNRAVVEAWLLAEVLRRAQHQRRRCGQHAAREARARALAQLPPDLDAMHREGRLAPLVRHLPAALAEAFTLQYFDKVPMRAMMRRTGASPGVLTDRVRRAREQLRHGMQLLIGNTDDRYRAF